MTATINRVAVLGSGTMGSGIAAQIANAGVEVLLLDVVPDDAQDRNQLAVGAITRMAKTKPAPLMLPRNATRIVAGNLEDDLDKLATCDWIIEVVLEDLDIKHALYRKIDAHRHPDAVVSSNTSTLPLQQLTQGMSPAFRQHFLITHFFNPPRYMRLLEIVTGTETDHEQVRKVLDFADHKLGKTLVPCHDTPGFIANRIGTYWMHCAVTRAIADNISVEAADAVLGRPAGVPKTGVFGLVDLVGVDLMPHLFKSLNESLPDNDSFRELGDMPALIGRMIEQGYTGRKGKGGFYRLDDAGEKQVINLTDGSYHKAERPKVQAALAAKRGRLRATLSHDSAEGKYAWQVWSSVLVYAASLVPDIADDIEAVDRAMRLGYNWKLGPFELIDQLGVQWFIAKLESENRVIPHMLQLADDRSFYRSKQGVLQYLGTNGNYCNVRRADGVLLLQDIKRGSKPLLRNSQASLWNLGDGVACLEFHSKMNSLNPLTIALLRKSLHFLPKQGYRGLVLYNEGEHFSVGANLLMLLVATWLRLGFLIRWILRQGQFTFRDMQRANFPVVGAPSGMALGGGCEILLHCDALVAHAESYIGLVETGVGIVPGWGGCKEMLLRGKTSAHLKQGPMPALVQVFESLALAKVSTSAEEAKELLFLREGDTIVMNRDRLLATAKQAVLALAPGYEAPKPALLKLPGATGAAALRMGVEDYHKKGVASAHDVRIATELAKVLSGGDCDLNDELSEETVLALERDALVKLTGTKLTRQRISHMLFKGKPLRN
jgi:3-hydroxyacyl-CoA dehydrogenase